MGKKHIFVISVICLFILFFWNSGGASVDVQICPISDYVAKVQCIQEDSPFSIRLLVLKHCLESMADGDAKLAIQAANVAKSRGLRIRDIGNHYVDKNGEIQRASYANEIVWGQTQYLDIDQFKAFVKQQMVVGAEPGDTLVLFTIGHGSKSGYLDTLGQRPEVMKALAEAAEETEQETMWWQLSCYAAASLPAISTLNENQQDLFSICASSPANRESPAYVEGEHMEKVFTAMADRSPEIDPDQDDMVVAIELGGFLEKNAERGRGRLVFARSDREVIFGLNFAQRIPIIDRNSPQREYPRDYIPMPEGG